MPVRRRLVAVTAGLVLALVPGCSADEPGERRPGAPVTEDEARMLAGLLHRNAEQGGADFVATAPHGEEALLTLIGEVDFADRIGRAQAVLSAGDDSAERTRTVFFSPDTLWFGDVPGLPEALSADDAPDAAGDAAYLRRPLEVEDADGAPLVDVLAEMVLRLSAGRDDDPRAFLDGGYTWQGQRAIDGRLASVYASASGQTVAVAASDDLLLQYETRLPGSDIDVTVTLGDHGEQDIELPEDSEAVDVADHPEMADSIGL